jgi:surfactin synthase thioesterase subunit
MEKVSLFCLPFAGGNKRSYRLFQERTPSFINIVSLEYPGRGARIRENFASNANELVDDLYSQIKNLISRGKYAIYGHSLGGLVGFLLARKIISWERYPPMHLFVTGTSGPSSTSRLEKQFHSMKKEDFFEQIKSFGGLPEEILKDEEMLDFFEPILRADFKLSETYIHENREPLPVPFTVITGAEESLEEQDIQLWQSESTFSVDFIKMKGYHFFILENADPIMKVISKKILFHLKQDGREY